MARDPRCLRPRPPRASAGDARTGSGRLAGAARHRDERARRARAPRAVRARRRALLRRSERPRGRCLADVARRVAAPGDRYRGGGLVRRAAPAGECGVRRRRRPYRDAHDLRAAHRPLHPRNTGAHAIGEPPSVDGQARLDVPVVRVDDELERLGVPLDTVGLAWVDVEGYEPQVLDGLAKLMARAVPITFEFTPSRYAAERKQRLVARLAEHYTTVHSLGRLDPAAPIDMLAAREHTDDVLVY